MRQFFIPVEVAANNTIRLENEDFHYLVNVLRIEENSVITGIDLREERFLLRVVEIGKKHIALHVEKNISYEIVKYPAELILYQCVPRLPKMDGIIRMTTEAGISAIVPVLSRYSRSNGIDVEAVQGRKQRWEKIAKEALQQSGRRTIPALGEPCTLSEIPAIIDKHSIGVFGDESGKSGVALHHLLDTPQLRRVLCVIGPEGGFHDEERRALKQKNYSAVFLGENILRTETAAIFLCASVQLLLMEKASWTSQKKE